MANAFGRDAPFDATSFTLTERDPSARSAPLAAPFAVAGGACTWVASEALGVLSGSQAFGAALGAALVCCGIGLIVARARRFRHLTLCLAVLSAGAAIGLLWGLGLGLGAYFGDQRYAVYTMIAGAIFVQPYLLPLSLVHVFERRARRGRLGSIVESSDFARVWLACFIDVALAALIAGLSSSIATPLALVLLASAGMGLAVIAVRDFHLFRRVRRARASAELSTADPLHDNVPELDLGLGDERSLCDVKLGPVYRSDGHPGLVVIGDFDVVEPLLRRTAKVSGFLALGAVVALAHLAFRPVRFEPEPFDAPITRVAHERPNFDVPTGLSWYPQRPMLVDLTGDGVEDVIGLRWNSSDESKALSVVANDGRTLRPLWRTEPLRSQWQSGRTHLLRGGTRLFLTDSEGLVHFYDTQTGQSTREAVRVERSRIVCAAPSGPPTLFISDEKWTNKEQQGLLVDADGNMSPGARPNDCETFPEVSFRGVKKCAGKLKPKRVSQSFYQYEIDDVGIGVGYHRSQPIGSEVFGFDPKSCEIRWESPLAFSADPLHENPRLVTEVTKERVYGFYQLASGRWLLGARDPRTARVLWHREPPRAQHGSHFSSLTVSEQRLYLALDWRLEVFEPETGESVGVLW